MSVTETITQPWRNPVDYVKLAFWIVIFAVVAFIIYDGLRIVMSSIRSTAEAVA